VLIEFRGARFDSIVTHSQAGTKEIRECRMRNPQSFAAYSYTGSTLMTSTMRPRSPPTTRSGLSHVKWEQKNYRPKTRPILYIELSTNVDDDWRRLCQMIAWEVSLHTSTDSSLMTSTTVSGAPPTTLSGSPRKVTGQASPTLACRTARISRLHESHDPLCCSWSTFPSLLLAVLAHIFQ